MRLLQLPMKNFADLTEREVLAVAIPAEEEASRICMSFAGDLMNRYPTRPAFSSGWQEEKSRRPMLLEMYEQLFGPNLPPVRPNNVRRFLGCHSIWLTIWLTKNLSLDAIRKKGRNNGVRGGTRLHEAAEQVRDVGVRKLLGDLGPDVRAEEDKTRKRIFVLQYVQPGLAGLMDGSVSTLAALR